MHGHTMKHSKRTTKQTEHHSQLSNIECLSSFNTRSKAGLSDDLQWPGTQPVSRNDVSV